MSKPSSDVKAMRTEFQAYCLYLLIYVPVVLVTTVVLGLLMPYLLFGIKPSFVMHGWDKLWVGLYILFCIAVALYVGANAWLAIVRGSVDRTLAIKVLMPFGRDPIALRVINSWLPNAESRK